MYLVRNRELLKSKTIRANTGVTYLHLKKDHCDLFCGEKTGGRARFLKKKKKLEVIAIIHREGNGTPLQYSCLENPMDRGAWWAAVHGVANSWTRLSDFTFTFHFHALEKENGNPLQCSCLENPRAGEAWWAAVYGVTQSWT